MIFLTLLHIASDQCKPKQLSIFIFSIELELDESLWNSNLKVSMTSDKVIEMWRQQVAEIIGIILRIYISK